MGYAQGVELADVLVVGGGPVGLVTAYQLARHLPRSKYKITIIEQHEKSVQDRYGRAITLFPRSSELLDQLGLADKLAQQCFACRQTTNYDKHGQEAPDRGWNFAEDMKDSKWGFALILRQKYQEDIFRKALLEEGIEVQAPCAVTDVSISEDVIAEGYKVLATIEDKRSGVSRTIKSRYIIGADGGKSSVRRALNIPFDGCSTENTWVRVDGIVANNVPKSRGYCAIESPTHGNVLWQAMDHGATRIGFALTPERQRAYDVFDESAAVHEATLAVRPFSIKFESVDWWTVYTVGQRVARSFAVSNCAFLVGDACHTHSSGAAQGLNVGIHDSVNLCWKLSLVLQNKAPLDLLSTYESERLPIIQKLIKYNKDISQLMTGNLPEGWDGDPGADTHEVLSQVMRQAGSFNTGLGIAYDPNTHLVRVDGSSDVALVRAGERAPDCTIQKPATFEATRLQTETPNMASFYVAVFAGDIQSTRSALASFADTTISSSVDKRYLPIEWLSIFAVGDVPCAFDLLGTMPMGRIFFDKDCSAHGRYGIDITKGAVIVLRPDGWIGMVLQMNAEAGPKLKNYFSRILLSHTDGTTSQQ